MSKKMCKRIFSVILSLGLVMVQSMNVNAAGNEGLSAEQLNTLLEGMDSMFCSWKNWDSMIVK